jgi:hypothetical protein
VPSLPHTAFFLWTELLFYCDAQYNSGSDSVPHQLFLESQEVMEQAVIHMHENEEEEEIME